MDKNKNINEKNNNIESHKKKKVLVIKMTRKSNKNIHKNIMIVMTIH